MPSSDRTIRTRNSNYSACNRGADSSGHGGRGTSAVSFRDLHRVPGVLLSFPGSDHAENDRRHFEEPKQITVERRANVDCPRELFRAVRLPYNESLPWPAILRRVICGYLWEQHQSALSDWKRSKIRQAAFGSNRRSIRLQS